MSGATVYGSKLVGYRPDLLPGQSAFGWVARLARLNQLRPEDLHRILGLRVRRTDDLVCVLARSERAREVLADTLMHQGADEWRPRYWWPFSGGRPDLALEPFRYCLGCIRVGYHPLLHQMPWISTCPWHGIRLRAECPRCDGQLTVSGDTGRKLLSCQCGLDLLNESAAARLSVPPDGAAAAIARYASEASMARDKWMLVGLNDVSLTSSMLAALLPSELICNTRGRQHTDDFHSRTYRRHQWEAQARSWPKGIVSDCPEVLELPEGWAKSVHAIARSLASKLPSGSLTLQEHLLFLGGQVANHSKFSPADRGTSGTVRCLPPVTAGSREFLNLSSVHPVVVRTMAELAGCPGPMKSGPDVQGPLGSALAHKVAGALLSRGYAEGLRAVLSRYVPALYDLPRDRPHLSAAWMLVSLHSDEISVAFARIGTRSAPSDALTSARANPSRSH